MGGAGCSVMAKNYGACVERARSIDGWIGARGEWPSLSVRPAGKARRGKCRERAWMRTGDGRIETTGEACKRAPPTAKRGKHQGRRDSRLTSLLVSGGYQITLTMFHPVGEDTDCSFLVYVVGRFFFLPCCRAAHDLENVCSKC